jgi:hypothetical protein
MLNPDKTDPNHYFHERVSQYRAKLILHEGFKRYRRTFGDSIQEIADYLGWSQGKLRGMVYNNFYARKTEDIVLLCRLFQCDAGEATRPYSDADAALALEVMAIDEEPETKTGTIEHLYVVSCEGEDDWRKWDRNNEAILERQTHFHNLLHKAFLFPKADTDEPVTSVNIHGISEFMSDADVCNLISIRAERMSQHNLLELTKDLMMIGMTRGTQTELPLPDFE